MSLLKITEEFLDNSDSGKRKEKGQYFTPSEIKKAALDQVKLFDGAKILENSCGTGEFIHSILERNPNVMIDAYDIDPALVALCKNQFPSINVDVCDFLEQVHKPKYDFVIGNPPYFEYLKADMSDTVKNKFNPWLYGRPNIYALFVKASIDCLVEGGKLVFVIPKSINNGQHFKKFRDFIISTCNILNMSFYNANMFKGATQEVMILTLQKLKRGEYNNGDYIFYKDGMDFPIFTLYKDKLEKAFDGAKTLKDLGYKVSTGNFVWNQNKDIISRNNKDIKLLWSSNIVNNRIKLDLPSFNLVTTDSNPKPKFQKGQYVSSNDKITPLKAKSIVVNRVVGTSNSSSLRAAIVDYEEEYYVENHLNVITANSNHMYTLDEIYSELIKPEKVELLKMITGNTQLSARELENLIPMKMERNMTSNIAETNIEVKIKKLHPNAVIPSYAKNGDAALDLHAVERGTADKYGNMVYKTGLAMEIPEGYVGLIYPRSSISKTKQMLRNHVGVIDSGYRGEVILKFGWFSQAATPDSSVYDAGDRIAQLMIVPHPKVQFVEVDELSDTDRGDGGFGSTGQ